MSRRRLGLALLAGGGGVFVGASYLAARALSHRLISSSGLGPTLVDREDLLEVLRESGASVFDFRHSGSVRDPVSLSAIFATPQGAAPRPTILFLHGKGGNSAEWQPDALRALALGYGVLIPDLRAHRPSGGEFVTYGFLEKDDLGNALEHARRFGLDPERIGLHACSAGSTVALEFAAGRSGVRALWIESPWADAREMARHYLSVATGLPAWLLDLTTRLAVRRALARIRKELDVTGGDDALAAGVDPVRSLGEVRGRVCLVYGERDELVPPRFVRRLEESLPPGSLVWRAAAAGHCHHDDEAERVDPVEYRRRWEGFFLENLPVA
jgi:pimeloyl-ACP methyl ester carboxylesterase